MSKRGHSAADRRPLRFWQPFNDWWRAELEKQGRRPNAQEIQLWYSSNAQDLWKEEAPSLQETRVHAKCLRSLPLVRDYFRNYRAKKRNNTYLNDNDGDEYANDDMGNADSGDEGADGSASPYRDDYEAQRPSSSGDFTIHQHLGAAWPQPLTAAAIDPSQQELLRNLAMSQLQHAAALQQQITLAALAQQFAASRAAAGLAGICNSAGDEATDMAAEPPCVGNDCQQPSVDLNSSKSEDDVQPLSPVLKAREVADAASPKVQVNVTTDAPPMAPGGDATMVLQQTTSSASEAVAVAEQQVGLHDEQAPMAVHDEEAAFELRMSSSSREDLIELARQMRLLLKAAGFQLRAKDQELKDMQTMVELLQGSSGGPQQLASGAQDITTVLSALEQLRQQPPAPCKANQ